MKREAPCVRLRVRITPGHEPALSGAVLDRDDAVGHQATAARRHERDDVTDPDRIRRRWHEHDRRAGRERRSHAPLERDDGVSTEREWHHRERGRADRGKGQDAGERCRYCAAYHASSNVDWQPWYAFVVLLGRFRLIVNTELSFVVQRPDAPEPLLPPFSASPVAGEV